MVYIYIEEDSTKSRIGNQKRTDKKEVEIHLDSILIFCVSFLIEKKIDTIVDKSYNNKLIKSRMYIFSIGNSEIGKVSRIDKPSISKLYDHKNKIDTIDPSEDDIIIYFIDF